MNLKPAIDIIKEFEGCVLKAYKDPVGIWTIGFGTIRNVKPGMKITMLQAEAFLEDDIMKERLPAVKKYVLVPISNNEMCALISFCYNVGVAALSKSTLIKKLNEGKKRKEVSDEFNKWTRAKGKVLKGLVRRRAAERKLFLTPDPVEQKLV